MAATELQAIVRFRFHDGSVEAFKRAIESQVTIPVVLQDERLSSTEAESRLALRESDWRKRKQKLDAAAAAVILQDYLDGRSRPAPESIHEMD